MDKPRYLVCLLMTQHTYKTREDHQRGGGGDGAIYKRRSGANNHQTNQWWMHRQVALRYWIGTTLIVALQNWMDVTPGWAGWNVSTLGKPNQVHWGFPSGMRINTRTYLSLPGCPLLYKTKKGGQSKCTFSLSSMSEVWFSFYVGSKTPSGFDAGIEEISVNTYRAQLTE